VQPGQEAWAAVIPVRVNISWDIVASKRLYFRCSFNHGKEAAYFGHVPVATYRKRDIAGQRPSGVFDEAWHMGVAPYGI